MKKFNVFALIFIIAAFSLNIVSGKRCYVRSTKQIGNLQKDPETKSLQEFKYSFDISGCLNLMPIVDRDPDIEEAYFIVNFELRRKQFFKQYKIEKIELNGKPVNKDDIMYGIDPRGFRFFSTNFKIGNDNEVIIIVKDKKTNEQFIKKINDINVVVVE